MTDKTLAILRGLVAVDKNGNHSIRVVTTNTPVKDLKNAVSPTVSPTLETLLSNCVVLDEAGNPALSLVLVPFGKLLKDDAREKRAKFYEGKKKQAEKAAKANAKGAEKSAAKAKAKAKESAEIKAANAKKKAEAKAKAEGTDAKKEPDA